MTRPSARATSIAINFSATTKLHTDKNNIGPSWVMCMGNFQRGGRLWTYCGDDKYELIDTSSGLYKFDAQIPHLTEPFSGERFTITYYTDGRVLERSGIHERLAELSNLGAPVPQINTLQKWKKISRTWAEQNKNLRAAESSSLKFLSSSPPGN
eukprot:12427969-Karenia_brevis.AAC.1